MICDHYICNILFFGEAVSFNDLKVLNNSCIVLECLQVTWCEESGLEPYTMNGLQRDK
jgi:hypothetical protein